MKESATIPERFCLCDFCPRLEPEGRRNIYSSVPTPEEKEPQVMEGALESYSYSGSGTYDLLFLFSCFFVLGLIGGFTIGYLL